MAFVLLACSQQHDAQKSPTFFNWLDCFQPLKELRESFHSAEETGRVLVGKDSTFLTLGACCLVPFDSQLPIYQSFCLECAHVRVGLCTGYAGYMGQESSKLIGAIKRATTAFWPNAILHASSHRKLVQQSVHKCSAEVFLTRAALVPLFRTFKAPRSWASSSR